MMGKKSPVVVLIMDSTENKRASRASCFSWVAIKDRHISEGEPEKNSSGTLRKYMS